MDGLEAEEGVISLGLHLPEGRPARLLFIGSHADDIEIGCGGTVLELLRNHPSAEVHWCVLSAVGTRADEARKAAARLATGAADHHLHLQDFRESYFPSVAADIKDYFESLKASVNPDVIFTHQREDLHQDHRIASELTWNSWRNHFILEYEIPKYDGGLGSPSVFMPIAAESVRRKVDVLTESFVSQRDKPWFAASTFEALMRLRGVECHAPSGYAEAFYCRKLVLAGR
jgi:LmbE family N-acetylglucosaminyl deacetylase